MNTPGRFPFYTAKNGAVKVEVFFSNIFEKGKLDGNSVVAKFATTAADVKTYQVDYYNLDKAKPRKKKT